MIRSTDREIADTLLIEWHGWCRQYRPALGAPRVSPNFRSARSGRQYDDATEASCGRLWVTQMESVDWCIDQLPTQMQSAIGTEMRNRTSAKVWRQPDGVTFEEAIELLLPIMRKRGLFD